MVPIRVEYDFDVKTFNASLAEAMKLVLKASFDGVPTGKVAVIMGTSKTFLDHILGEENFFKNGWMYGRRLNAMVGHLEKIGYRSDVIVGDISYSLNEPRTLYKHVSELVDRTSMTRIEMSKALGIEISRLSKFVHHWEKESKNMASLHTRLHAIDQLDGFVVIEFKLKEKNEPSTT